MCVPEACVQMFIAAAFVMTPNWKDPRCPTNERTDEQTVAHPCQQTRVSGEKEPVSVTHTQHGGPGHIDRWEGCVSMLLYCLVTDPFGCLEEAVWEILAKDAHTVTAAVTDSVSEGWR